MLRVPEVSLILLFISVTACSTPHPVTPQAAAPLNAAPPSTTMPLPQPSPSATATPRPTPTVPPTISVPPTIIPHPKPALSVDLQVLRDAGCAIDWGRYGGAWVCPDNAAIKALGCDTLAPDNLFAGFTPFYPIMRCRTFQSPPPDSEHFRCVDGGYHSYLLFKDGQYRLIANQSELQALFAPVESADEALAFALVATDLAAKYGLEGVGGQYYAETIEGTHVDEAPEGYVIHLFANTEPLCGCGPHITSAVDVLVTREGRVEVISTQPAYGYGACIDCWPVCQQ
jgi:hypothetical protein